MESAVKSIIYFEEFSLEPTRRVLKKNGEIVSLNQKALELLLVLVEKQGEVVEKNELLDKVWTDQFVEENNLTVHVASLRKAFGEKKGEHKFIVTVPGRGYSFVAEIRQEGLEKNSVATALQIPNLEKSRQLTTDNVVSRSETLIGRAREVAEITTLLQNDDFRLLTLTGAGGSGKTTLARAIGEELQGHFADGTFFIELAAVSDPKLAVPVVAQTFAIKESGEKSLFEALVNYLREKRILLILDNFEQILAAAPLVQKLLDSTVFLKILVTSRAVLHLKSEYEILVSPLALPPPDAVLTNQNLSQYAAAALFMRRAQNTRRNFILTDENAQFVSEICRRLDGLPLAIELAAARIKLLSPKAILNRLENSLQLLTGGAGDLPLRQQTMVGAIRWSYDLLNEDEKYVFRQLSVFAGGFTVEAAEAVCENHELRIANYEASEPQPAHLYPKSEIHNPESEVLDLLTSLADNNLLTLKEEGTGEIRLRMLEVVREFAFGCLEERGETRAVKQRHARFYLKLSEEAEPHLFGEKSVEWLETLEVEIDNLRAALAWSFEFDADVAARLAGATRHFWIYHSHLTEGRNWLNAALSKSGAANPELRFKLLYGLGIMARVQGDYQTAREMYNQALVEGRASGNRQQIALSSSGLGAILQLTGDAPAARKYFEEGLAVSRELGDEYSIAYSLLCLGIVLGMEGKSSEARKVLEESLTILRKFGSKEAISNNLNNLGAVAFDVGDYEAALGYFTEGLQLSQEVGNKVNITDALNGLAALAAEDGKFEMAAKIAGSAENLSKSIGFEKEPTERHFCEKYISKIRAALDSDEFFAAFEQGRLMDTGEAVALARVSASKYYAQKDGTEIIIESRTVSRILIEEEILEENDEDSSQGVKKTYR